MAASPAYHSKRGRSPYDRLKNLLFSVAKSRRRIAGTLGLTLVLLFSTFRKDVRHVKYNAPKAIRQPVGTKNNIRSGSRKKLEPWSPGILDIHHLQVGSSVSSFIIMPDGTTMVIDTGDVNVPNTLKEWSKMGPPFDKLQLRSPYPHDNNGKTPVEWILEYLQEFWPHKSKSTSSSLSSLELDYLLLTHFHSDHLGDGSDALTHRSKSLSGKYVLSGIPELTSKIKVKKIIDRGFPDYNVPLDLRTLHDKTIDNYLQFVQENQNNIHFEQFQVGSSQQIQMQHAGNQLKLDDFRIQIIKSGMDVAAPRRENDSAISAAETVKVQKIPGDILSQNGHGNENTMSAAIVVEYGSFRYYEGADQEMVRNDQGKVIFDTIGPTAQAAGKVDVATLNHHGHGVSPDYLTYIDPPIMVLQGWSLDQPPTKSMEMLSSTPVRVSDGGDVVPRKIFATDVFRERLDDMGPSLSKLFQSTSGHVVVRVHPPPTKSALRGKSSDGKRQTFEIAVLDGDRNIKHHYGHFPVRATR